MKQLIGTALVITLILSATPVLASDSFHALSQLPASLTSLDDAQLATVEGGDMTDLQRTTSSSQSTSTSTSVHVSQNTTIHTYQAESLWAAVHGDAAAAQALAEWLWATTQGNMAAVQEFLAGWLQR